MNIQSAKLNWDERLTVEELEKNEQPASKRYPRPALKTRTRFSDNENRPKDMRRAMVISRHITSTVDSEQFETRERDNANERDRQKRFIDLDDSGFTGNDNGEHIIFAKLVCAATGVVVA